MINLSKSLEGLPVGIGDPLPGGTVALVERRLRRAVSE